MSRTAAWGAALAACALVVVVDQASKQAAIDALAGAGPADLPLGFQLDLVDNEGIAFGLFDDGGALVIAITLAALAALIAWFSTDPSRPGLWAASGLIAGGALGNLADRLREGAVTDFIDPPRWPAFNLADVAITVGVLLLLLAYTGKRKA